MASVNPVVIVEGLLMCDVLHIIYSVLCNMYDVLYMLHGVMYVFCIATECCVMSCDVVAHAVQS